MSGAICGGNRKEAEEYIAAARCKKHRTRKTIDHYCKQCLDIWLKRLDANFLSVI